MTIEFTSTGVTIDTFNEIYENISDGMADAYGSAITFEQDSPDGQATGISALADLNLQSFLLSLYSNFDPDVATGAMQAVILKYCGMTKSPASRSTVDLDITATKEVTIPEGYIVSDDNGQEWETEDETTISTGTTTVSFVASEWGDVSAAAGTITTPVTIVLGVSSVTNSADAVAGSDEETDSEVRIRRNKALENQAESTVGAMASKLLNISGVTDVAVYENDTDAYDSDTEMDAHSIWIVVLGGDVSDINETIAIQKNIGCALKGAESGSYIEYFERSDGSTKTYTHTTAYDRPTEVPIYVTLNAKRKIPGESIETELIQTEIASKAFYIAESLQASELYSLGYDAGTNFVLYDLLISTDGVTYTDEYLKPGYDEVFSLETSNVVVTEVA